MKTVSLMASNVGTTLLVHWIMNPAHVRCFFAFYCRRNVKRIGCVYTQRRERLRMEVNFTRGIWLKKFHSQTMNYTFDYRLRALVLYSIRTYISYKNKLFYNEKTLARRAKSKARWKKQKLKSFLLLWYFTFCFNHSATEYRIKFCTS